METDLNVLLERVVQRAERQGATAADALAVEQVEGTVRVRLGEVEQIQRARQRRVGLRVFMGQRHAITASGDLREETLDRLVDDTCAMARLTAEDPVSGLPPADRCGARHVHRADLFDPTSDDFDLEQAADWARKAEAAAMAVDPRIDNSEGAEFGFSNDLRAYRASGGVAGSYRTSHFTGYVVPVATLDGAMERDYHYSQRRHYSDLGSPDEIGRIAAERTLRRLGATKGRTGEVPVVFEERTASQLLGHIASALSGYAIYRGASFLRGRLGEKVASERVTLIDDPLMAGGMGSKPYDGEGIGTFSKTLIGGGVLETYLLDIYSARKLGLETTGNAARAVGDAPTVGVTNLHMQVGDYSPEELIAELDEGLYVTELIGFGVNTTTGDYSQGAAGLWIENGKLSHAVSEVTIASNLLTMLQDVDAVANDLERHRSVSAPSFRIRKMMVAGE